MTYKEIPITVLDTFSNMPTESYLPSKRNLDKVTRKRRKYTVSKYKDKDLWEMHRLRQQGYTYREISDKLEHLDTTANAVRAVYTTKLNKGYFETCP